MSGLCVSASFFPVLGVKPMLGRVFLPEEEFRGKDHEVILSYGLWKRRYGGDATIIGRTIKMDGEDFIVVGVMPREFTWQFWSGPRQLWVPVGYTKTDYARDSNSFLSFARLKPGVTVAQARLELGAVVARLAKQFPADYAGVGATVEPLGEYGLDGLRHELAHSCWASRRRLRLADRLCERGQLRCLFSRRISPKVNLPSGRSAGCTQAGESLASY